MKANDVLPEDKSMEEPIKGDVIGSTVYSERFVLKILLKFANLNTLTEELKEENFEKDLCILWDMTTEVDVVNYLLEHKFPELLEFVIPLVTNNRLNEILIGILGNIFCCKESAQKLIARKTTIDVTLQLIKSEDPLLLIQVFRTLNSGLYYTQESDLETWLHSFAEFDFVNILEFILKSSSNKDLLSSALECLNSILTKFNVERYQTKICNMFIHKELIRAFHVSFNEIYSYYNEIMRNDLERIYLISLQIALIITSNRKGVYNDGSFKELNEMIVIIMTHYCNKVIEDKDYDEDIFDVIESVLNISNMIGSNEKVLSENFDSLVSVWLFLTISDKGTNEMEEDRPCYDFITCLKKILSKFFLQYFLQLDETKLETCVSRINVSEMENYVDKESWLLMENKIQDLTKER